jgi:hypothetical protein
VVEQNLKDAIIKFIEQAKPGTPWLVSMSFAEPVAIAFKVAIISVNVKIIVDAR